MIIAPAEFQLLIALADSRPDGGGVGEVKGSSLNAAQLTGGNQGSADGRELIGVDGEAVIQNGALRVAREIGRASCRERV